MIHRHADGSEECRPRTPEEQAVAMQNREAARITTGEIRMLMGTWRERGADRREHDRGSNLIGEQRRANDRRTA